MDAWALDRVALPVDPVAAEERWAAGASIAQTRKPPF